VAVPTPWPLRLLLSLLVAQADTSATGGSFQCVPGFHREFASWAAAQQLAPGERLNASSLSERAVQIPGRKGDLLIWHSALPHGNGRNTDSSPRLAAYLSMWPAGDQQASGEFQQRSRAEEERAHRLMLFDDRVWFHSFAALPILERAQSSSQNRSSLYS
jgi:ectoine hydroxylase-related dioxygenase (phytanoyl-CoA dioxygenase family)